MISLTEAGMSPAEAANKSILFERCEAALKSTGKSDSIRHYVPGRVEFLGKHTDYAGGRSLICAVERGICMLARPRSDNQINIAALDLPAHASFALSPDLTPTRGDWSNYPMTVARRIARNFSGGPAPLRGADIAFAGDLPPAAGLSSSSALIIATFLALRVVNHLADHPAYQQNIHNLEDLSGYLGCNENGQTFGTLAGDKGVGTFGGSQDHTAIICSKPNNLSQYAFCPVRFEADVPWPSGHVLAIGVSGVLAEKTGAAMDMYNSASKRTAAIVEIWRNSTGRQAPTLAAALATSPKAAGELRQVIADMAEESPEIAGLRLNDRIEQFQTESETIIPQAAAALRQGRLDTLGKLVDLSQSNAEKLLLNQVPETIALCRIARELGASAASAFGAGFGGAVWALIPQANSQAFLAHWSERYRQKFPALKPNFLLTRPGPAAQKV